MSQFMLILREKEGWSSCSFCVRQDWEEENILCSGYYVAAKNRNSL